MKGTITWLEATMPNIVEIPINENEGIEDTITVKVKDKEGKESDARYNHVHDLWEFETGGFDTDYTITHFAYINEPE